MADRVAGIAGLPALVDVMQAGLEEVEAGQEQAARPAGQYVEDGRETRGRDVSIEQVEGLEEMFIGRAEGIAKPPAGAMLVDVAKVDADLLAVTLMPFGFDRLRVRAFVHAQPHAREFLRRLADRGAVEGIMHIGAVALPRPGLEIVHADHDVMRIDEAGLVLDAGRRTADDDDAPAVQPFFHLAKTDKIH